MQEQNKFKKYFYFIIIGNTLCWAIALLFSFNSILKISYSCIAYFLGIRHALDADHVSTIDNITRRFIDQKNDARGVGVFFSLGHSSVVIILTFVIASLPYFTAGHFTGLKKYGDVIGSSISICTLMLLGFSNLLLSMKLLQKLSTNKEAKIDSIVGGITKLSSCINHNYSIYLLGILFGLSFDSATEIALYGLASMNAIVQNAYLIILLPLLFSAGMCLIDALINQLSVKVYLQFSNTHYQRINLALTAFIALSGLLIAICEMQHLIETKYQIFMPIFSLITQLTLENFQLIGLVITLVLVFCYVLFFYSKYLKGNLCKLNK